MISRDKTQKAPGDRHPELVQNAFIFLFVPQSFGGI